MARRLKARAAARRAALPTGAPPATSTAPAPTVAYTYHPGQPVENIDDVHATLGRVRVTVQRVTLSDGSEAPEWWLGLYRGAPNESDATHGELEGLSAADVLALHEVLGAAIAEAWRRELL